MELHLAVDDLVLAGAAVVVVGVLTAGLAGRVRVPSLLVFLVLGMVVADDGLGMVRFDDAELAQSVSVAALVLILFEGGLASSRRREAGRRARGAPRHRRRGHHRHDRGRRRAPDLRRVGTTAWLLGAVVASTDAAAVMTVLGALRCPSGCGRCSRPSPASTTRSPCC